MLAAVGALLLLAAAAPAYADDASLAEVAELAEAARTDQTALTRLLAVTSVEGHPVDMSAILSGDSLDARLQHVAALRSRASFPEGRDPAELIAEILARRRVETPEGPAVRPGNDPVEGTAEEAPRSGSGFPVAWLLVILGLIAAILVFSFLVGNTKRRERPQTATRSSAAGSPPVDKPTELEARADDAEKSGEFSRAVKLRFRARLLRLERLGKVPHRSVATGRAVRRAAPRRAG